MNRIRFPWSRGKNTAVPANDGHQVKHFLGNIHEEYNTTEFSYRLSSSATIKYSTKPEYVL